MSKRSTKPLSKKARVAPKKSEEEEEDDDDDDDDEDSNVVLTRPRRILRMIVEKSWNRAFGETLQLLTKPQQHRGSVHVNIQNWPDRAECKHYDLKVMSDVANVCYCMTGVFTTVEEFSLTNIPLNRNAIVAIQEGFSMERHLKTVNLDNVWIHKARFSSLTLADRQMLWKTFSETIASLQSLERLRMSNVRLSSTLLSTVVTNSSSIKSLELLSPFSSSRREDQTIATLMDLLPHNRSLTYLHIGPFGMDANAVATLVQSLHHALPLCNFRISGNSIGSAGLITFVRALVQHPTWDALELVNDKTIGYQGLTILGQELQQMVHQQEGYPNINNNHDIYNRKRISLTFQDCVTWVEYSGEEKKSQAAIQQDMAYQRAEQALLHAVKDNAHIVKLSSIFETAMIKQYTQLNEMGRYLLGMLDHRQLPATLWCHVLVKCWSHPGRREWPATSIMFYLLREQPHLMLSSSSAAS